MGAHVMTVGQKQMARRLKSKGMKFKEIARELNVSLDLARATHYRKQVRPGRPDGWEPAARRLSAEEREDIMIGLRQGESMTSIAGRLGRAPSTVTREVSTDTGLSPLAAIRSPRVWPSASPGMATEFRTPALRSLGQWLHPLPAGGVLQPNRLSRSLDHVGMVEQTIDEGGGETGRHELVEARGVEV